MSSRVLFWIASGSRHATGDWFLRTTGTPHDSSFMRGLLSFGAHEMNLTPAHIRNHYFSREDMSHLRVPRSDPANNQVLGDYIFDLSEPPRWEPSPSNSPSPSPAHEEPAPPCAAAEFFDYHDDLPYFTMPHHRMNQVTMTKKIPPRLGAAFYLHSPRPSPPGNRRQSTAAPLVNNLVDIVTHHQNMYTTLEPRLQLLHHLFLLVLGPQLMINYFAPTKMMPGNDRAGRRWPKSYAAPKMTVKSAWNLIRTSPAGTPPDNPPPLPPAEPPMDDSHDPKERSPKRRKS